MPKVLISDKMAPDAAEIFKNRGIEVDVKTGMTPDELKACIAEYDGLAIRSATKATAEIIEAATNMKVIGRAGIGTDNVDKPAATARGIVVMNTPFGNSITTAEHAIAMMMASARMIPQANSSTHAGKWEKSKFMGAELMGKTLGVIGAGNIGAAVCERALGLKMKVVAFDPFLSPERAVEIGVEKVELDDLFGRADFITLHTPLTDQTRNIIDTKAILKMKKGVRIINCARGGLVVEKDLKEAIESGHVAGAALDVFEEEPAKENDLFGMDQVICTPHLGASTTEAQEKVALQVAEQMADYLLTGAVTNALNMPSVSAEDAPKLKPYMELCEQLGSFAGQIVEGGLEEVKIEYEGAVSGLNTTPLNAVVLTGLFTPLMEGVNMVSAPAIAKDRDISVTEVKQEKCAAYQSMIRLTVRTSERTHTLAGALFGSRPRIVEVGDIAIDAELGENVVYVRNEDKPGLIGALGTILGDAGINIATFHLGRHDEGGDAIALVTVDQDPGEEVMKNICQLDQVIRCKALKF